MHALRGPTSVLVEFRCDKVVGVHSSPLRRCRVDHGAQTVRPTSHRPTNTAATDRDHDVTQPHSLRKARRRLWINTPCAASAGATISIAWIWPTASKNPGTWRRIWSARASKRPTRDRTRVRTIGVRCSNRLRRRPSDRISRPAQRCAIRCGRERAGGGARAQRLPQAISKRPTFSATLGTSVIVSTVTACEVFITSANR